MIDPTESLRLSVRAITSHKLRSTLTTLGVVIGVAAVITFVTLGASLQAGIVGDLSPDDRGNVYVWAAPPDAEGGPGAGAQPVFTERDADEIAQLEGVDEAYPYSQLPTQALSYRNQTVAQQGGVIAAGDGYLSADDLAEGELYTDGEREVVLNAAAAARFDTNASVGDEITIVLATGQRVNATVVGVLADSESQGPFEGFGSAPRVYLPIDPFYTDIVSGGDETARFASLVVEAENGRVDAAKDSTRSYLESDASDASDRDGGLAYSLETSVELLDQLRGVIDQLTGFITGIAVISLVVGAIGIANIMLVSVTERTREIGIMKAVGAQNRDVLVLFLTEAVILGLVGSLLGVVVGYAGGFAATEVIGLPLTIPYEWAGIAVVVGVLVGVVAGLYPAWSAARTDPIDALRYE